MPITDRKLPTLHSSPKLHFTICELIQAHIRDTSTSTSSGPPSNLRSHPPAYLPTHLPALRQPPPGMSPHPLASITES